MDAKELENPMHVFNTIEPTLKGSGESLRYKDWTRKIKNHSDYDPDAMHSEQVQSQLFLIRFRKETKQYFEELEQLLAKAVKMSDLELRTRIGFLF
jgi:hypothetical protein